MKRNWILPVVLMVVFAITRWPSIWPDEWASFTPAYALAFCAGVYFSRAFAWWLPLLTLLLSDIAMNVFHYHRPAVSVFMLPNYLAYVFLIGLGRLHSPSFSWARLLMGGVIGAAVFYLITNTTSWIQSPDYPKTLAGWFQALTVGTPGYPPTWTFFRNTILSGGLFTGLFVGTMKATQESEPAEEEELEEAEPEPE